MEKYWHNLYLKEDFFLKEFRKNGLKLVKKIKYGKYQVLSKIIYPNLIYPSEPNFLSAFNKLAAKLYISDKNFLSSFIKKTLHKKLKNLDDISHQTSYILKKIE